MCIYIYVYTHIYVYINHIYTYHFYVMFLWVSLIMKSLKSHFQFTVIDTEQRGICFEMAKLVNPSVVVLCDYNKP